MLSFGVPVRDAIGPGWSRSKGHERSMCGAAAELRIPVDVDARADLLFAVTAPGPRILDVHLGERPLGKIALEGPDDELRQLADTFDDMLARLDAAFESQRAFIHEASHELRNPIAVIRTNVDVALDDPDASADDLRDTVEIVGRSAERMSVLVDDLLTYARRESPAERTDIIDIGGESTRPGAREIPAMEETARVLPVIQALADGPAPISIDTRKAAIAKASLAASSTS